MLILAIIVSFVLLAIIVAIGFYMTSTTTTPITTTTTPSFIEGSEVSEVSEDSDEEVSEDEYIYTETAAPTTTLTPVLSQYEKCIVNVETYGYIPGVTLGSTPAADADSVCDKLLCDYWNTKYGANSLSYGNIPNTYKGSFTGNCKYPTAAWKIYKTSDGNKIPLRLGTDGSVECMSQDGINCLWGREDPTPTDPLKPSSCGANKSGWCNPEFLITENEYVPSSAISTVEKFTNVVDFGADPTGVKDSTIAIQKAIDTAGQGGSLYFKNGIYIVTSTLKGLTNQSFIGNSPNSTMIYRIGNYGDTLLFESAGAIKMHGLWFNHGNWDGSGNIENVATTGAHLRLKNAQFSVIDNCWFWRMPYGIHLSGTITTIRKCWLQGTWDHTIQKNQEGIANIYIESGAIITVENCYISGPKSVARNVVYNNTLSVSKAENIGSRFGICIEQCEDFICSNNFIGTNNVNGLYSNLRKDSVNLEWRITGNFFDNGSSNPSGSNIYLHTSTNSTINGLVISNNVFNGELVAQHAIVVYSSFPDKRPLLSNFTITSNTFQAYTATVVALYSAANGVISGNTITGYNVLGASKDSLDYVVGLLLIGNVKYVHVYGNNVGGSINTGLPTEYTYKSIENLAENPALNSVHDNLVIKV